MSGIGPDPRRALPPGPDTPEDRESVLISLEDWLEGPMTFLGFVWLALMVVDFVSGLPRWLTTVETVIWVVFILDFGLRFWLAPRKLRYLRHNVLTALSLVLPALRVFRVFRAVRALRAARALRGAARGSRVVRVVGSLNRAMHALGRSFGRRGFGYVVALSLIVLLAGAAGMLAFERDVPGSSIDSYGTALWWTAMVMTTMGSDYFPHSPEGRVLCLLLAIFAFAVFGYVTATLATFFVGREAENDEGELAGGRSVEALRHEVEGLRREVQALRADLGVERRSSVTPEE
jgi:voltage-gated potassium channel